MNMPPRMPFGPYEHISNHPLYRTWAAIIQRCSNPRNPNFGLYGGRGIRVHDAWRDAATFLTWLEANLGPRPHGMTLDRIDNNGSYEPGNLRWATISEQNRNQRPRPWQPYGKWLDESDLIGKAPGA